MKLTADLCVVYALQAISYMAERVVGHGSFGTVFQVCCCINQYYN
jgi:hypothetical protein